METSERTKDLSIKNCIEEIVSFANKVDINNQLSEIDSVENKFNFLLCKIREWKISGNHICNVDQLWQKLSLGKDDEKAIQKREEGNALFKKRQYSQALQAYNKSVFYSSCHTDLENSANFLEFSLALANRAAVLSKFGLHHEVIQDLRLAIQSGYPAHLLHKAFLRLSTAYMFIQDYANAKNYGEQALQAICGLQDISNSSRNQMKVECSQLVKTAEMKTINCKQEFSLGNPKEGRNNSHADIKYFSDCIDVKEDEEHGRFVTAGRDIEVGEVVSREESMSSMLNLTNITTHCSSCHKQVIAPLPCSSCQSVSFCSMTCWKSGIGVHKWECWMSLVDVPKEEASFLKQAMLAYRQVVKQDIDFHLENKSIKTGGSDKEEARTRYQSLYRMVTHYEGLPLLNHIAGSIFLLFCLENSGYFGTDCRLESRMKIGYLLCHYYAITKSNSHTFSELRNKTAKKSQYTSDVGMALYPSTAGHFNHSCDPNTFVVYVANEQITIAARTIPSGEEVNHIYQGHYGDTSREKRRQTLKCQFHFWCECSACLADYPDSKTLAKTGNSFAEASESQMARQVRTKELQDADARHLELTQRAESCLREGDWSAALYLYKERSCLISKYLKIPHILHLLSRAAIINCMWFLMGNRAVNFVLPSLQTYG